MQSTPLPHFKYHPDPIGNGVIKQESTACPVCGKHREFVYVGPFYAPVDVEGICPWCIADGTAARMFGGEFMDPGTSEPASDASMEEVAHRTPGYISWQDEPWLSHCGECCAFVGYVGWTEIEHLVDELSDDIARIEEEWQFGGEGLRGVLHREGDVTGYLFECTVCGRHRLHIDAN